MGIIRHVSDTPMQRNTAKFVLTAALAALAFVGSGCVTADKVADDALKPVSVPLDALQKAKDLTADLKAKNAEDAERNTNEISVAFVVTEGAEVPADATLEGEGMIGCNDRIAYAKVSRETASGDMVRDALETLFSVKETNYHGLYNALAFSDLKVDRILSRDGVTTDVEIVGSLNSGGLCDDPRIVQQIEATVRHFRPDYRILLNGSESEWKCVGNMSGQCP